MQDFVGKEEEMEKDANDRFPNWMTACASGLKPTSLRAHSHLIADVAWSLWSLGIV